MNPKRPRWTKRQLEVAFTACYGRSVNGGVDIDYVAAAFRVTRRTVQRWLQGSPRTRAAIPAHRLQQLQFPLPEIRRVEQQTLDNARTVLTGLDLPRGRGVRKEWRERRWLDPHVVAILRPHGSPDLRQVAIARGAPRPVAALHKRGPLDDFVTVPTRFHADALVGELLDRVGPWRLYPDDRVVELGRTRVWAAWAPPIDLPAIARGAGLLDN
ncbi:MULTISPECIES: hypothetical protein [unclassified Rhodococcus (in: high G+C Gram-positive bacteria)]|uniref:hypothetical protein n=1 Tax=unclassified Rhodococcus (in: high G+C Gram-positive bacteria) TaxID=192944 RepID=UPI0002AC38F0|nr:MULTISPECIES: hypothetical protein [unclassified Rhodococcus (in: high G+C Gram-positive bacteria)]CCQ18398.1 putative uncharacterized protein [Rhodococcus sp. AW25M09]